MPQTHTSCSIAPQRTHDLTHKPRSTPQTRHSRTLTSLPGLKNKSKAPGSQHKLCRAKKPTNGLARCETAQTPLPEHTHASQHHSRSEHGQGGGRTLGSLVGDSVPDFVKAVQGILNFLPRSNYLPQIPPSPTHGASPTECSWSAATFRRVWRLGGRSDRSHPCACEHKRPARALLASWEAL
jgi:hypothetical protein